MATFVTHAEAEFAVIDSRATPVPAGAPWATPQPSPRGGQGPTSPQPGGNKIPQPGGVMDVTHGAAQGARAWLSGGSRDKPGTGAEAAAARRWLSGADTQGMPADTGGAAGSRGATQDTRDKTVDRHGGWVAPSREGKGKAGLSGVA